MSGRPPPLCTVMLVDVAEADGEPRPAAVLRRRVHGLLVTALRGLPEESRLAVESGSAAVVCFVGDPEDGLTTALRLREQVAQHYGGKLSVRVALNLGTVQVELDPQDQFHIAGEGIHHAIEVKDRAGPNELLVSHSYHRLLSQLNPARAGSFVDHTPGEAQPVKVYAPSQPAALAPEPATGPVLLDAGAVQEIERELAGRIGPLASLLVRRIERRAGSEQALREAVAAAIPPSAAPPVQVPRPAEPPQLDAGPVAAQGSDSTRQIDVTPEELAIIERTLHLFVGPAATELIVREIEWCLQFPEFVTAVASSVKHAQQREVFLQALHRALPARRF